MKNTGIKVKIFKSDYNLLGENPAEVERIANYVDTTMQRIDYQSPNTSVDSIAVVTALNIAESYFKEKDARREMEKSITNLLNDITKKIDDLNKKIEEYI
jgi:cell division protein ZapA